MYFSQRDLKKGSVSVESKKPNAGTIALSQGLSILIARKYNPIATYVKIASNTFLDKLVSQALSISTFLLRLSIAAILFSKSFRLDIRNNCTFSVIRNLNEQRLFCNGNHNGTNRHHYCPDTNLKRYFFLE